MSFLAMVPYSLAPRQTRETRGPAWTFRTDGESAADCIPLGELLRVKVNFASHVGAFQLFVVFRVV